MYILVNTVTVALDKKRPFFIAYQFSLASQLLNKLGCEKDP